MVCLKEPKRAAVVRQNRSEVSKLVSHRLKFTRLFVYDLCQIADCFLNLGLLLGGDEAVVLQDTQLYVPPWCLGLYLLQQLFGRPGCQLL